jgi:hypothetical protein
VKPSWPIKTLVLLFVGALAFYSIAYVVIEQRRTRLGPWVVTFTPAPSTGVVLNISHARLQITNVQIHLPNLSTETNQSQTIRFDRPRPVPFPLPAGQCVFMDTTFQPGTVVIEAGAQQIQLLPRVLTINGNEQPWRSDSVIVLQPNQSTNGPIPRLESSGNRVNNY